MFEFANERYLELVGRDVVGKPVAAVLPEITAQGFVALLDRVLATGEPYVADEVQVDLQRDGAIESVGGDLRGDGEEVAEDAKRRRAP